LRISENSVQHLFNLEPKTYMILSDISGIIIIEKHTSGYHVI